MRRYMKLITYCLLMLLMMSTFVTAYGDITCTVPPITIMNQLTGIPDDYDIPPYISKPNEMIQIGHLTITLSESLADPYLLIAVFKCSCSDSDVELRSWYGMDSDLPRVLSHIKDSEDHRICYVNVSPETPFEEEAQDEAIQDNNLYYCSFCERSYSELAKCELNQPYTVDETITIRLIHMEAGEWRQETIQTVISIHVWPVIEKFELATPIEFPQYDLVVESAGVYLTPICAHVVRLYDSISKSKPLYHFFIKGKPQIKLAEELPNNLTVFITDDDDQVVYTEVYSKNKDAVYEKTN